MSIYFVQPPPAQRWVVQRSRSGSLPPNQGPRAPEKPEKRPLGKYCFSDFLGGGNSKKKKMFNPNLWGKSSKLTSIFFKWVGEKPPPSFPTAIFFQGLIICYYFFFESATGWPAQIFMKLTFAPPSSANVRNTQKTAGFLKSAMSIQMFTLPETNNSHLQIDPWKRRFLLETMIFRGYVCFREGVFSIKCHSNLITIPVG